MSDISFCKTDVHNHFEIFFILSMWLSLATLNFFLSNINFVKTLYEFPKLYKFYASSEGDISQLCLFMHSGSIRHILYMESISHNKINSSSMVYSVCPNLSNSIMKTIQKFDNYLRRLMMHRHKLCSLCNVQLLFRSYIIYHNLLYLIRRQFLQPS